MRTFVAIWGEIMIYRNTWHVCLLCCAYFIAACSPIPSNDGRLVDPTVKPKSALKAAPTPVPQAPPPRSGPVDVYIVPLDDFPTDVAATFAQRLAEDLSLNVRTMIPVNASKVRPLDNGQFAAEDLIALFEPTTALYRHDKTVFIIYTRRDLNDRERTSRFWFAQGNKEKRISVISTHRLYWDYRWVKPSALLSTRLFIMSKRSVGELYYGLSRSSDLKDIMYSPLKSAEDIDRIGSEFLALSK